MKSIGGLLQRGRPGERAEFSATFVIGAMNAVLQAALQLEPGDARAISYRQGTIVIGVSHGAVAGLVQQSASELITTANKKISTSGGAEGTIKKILTRPQTPPSP